MNNRSDGYEARGQAPWPRWVGYPIAVLLEAALTAGLLSLHSYLPLGDYPITYVLTIMAIAYWLGEGPAVLALILGLGIYDYYFVSPLHTLWPSATDAAGWAKFAAFFLGTVVVGFAMVVIRRSQRRSQRLAEELRKSGRRQELAAHILAKLNQHALAEDSIREMIKEFVGAEAAGIRVRQAGDFRLYASDGYSEGFLEAEDLLCIDTKTGKVVLDEDGRGVPQCLCGIVLRGRTDPAQSFFTPGGSFWTNNTSELLGCGLQERVGEPIRGRCAAEGYESLAIIPLRRGEEVLGLLHVTDTRPNRFTLDLVEFLEGIGASIGVAVARNQAEEQLRESRQTVERQVSHLQQALVPSRPSPGGGYRVAAVYLPAYPGEEIGGDFYDVFRTESGRIGIVIGDVSGKGIEAASLAAAARSTVRSFAYELSLPGAALSHANEVLESQESESERFVTVFLAIIDPSTGRLSYARAGHPPAAILQASGAVQLLGCGNLPMALAPGQAFETFEGRLDLGDKLVLYTDGILEARRGGVLFDEGGVRDALAKHGRGTPDEVAAGLLDAAHDWAEGHLQDDIAILVIERTSGESV